MVSSTTILNEEQLEVVEPRDRQLYTREGFDRKQIRYEFADSMELGLNDRYVRQEDVTYVNPDTTDMPHGPTGLGQTGGSGVDFIRQDGAVHPTFRFTQGFSANYEDLQADAIDLGAQRNNTLETFDWLADSMFLKGISDAAGNEVRPGVFKWLKQNIPAERTIDCENFDGDTGDEDYTGEEENVIKYDAFKEISGRIMDNSNPRWDMMIGRQDALARFNKRRKSDGGTDPRDTYWERLNSDGGVGVGVDDWKLIPDTLTFSKAPNGKDPIELDLTSELDANEVILLPDMEQVRNKFWRLREMSTPESLGPYEKNGGKREFEYIWRYSHSFDPKGEFGTAPDAIHLTNIDVLFN